MIAITRDALADEEVREALAERLADSVVAHFALGDDLAAATFRHRSIGSDHS